jgi:AraC-like DNA-binding protein
MHTVVADSANLRDRFGLVGSMIAANYGTAWRAEPLPGEQRAPRISWSACGGVGVSCAEMPPLHLRSSGITALHARQARKYYFYTATAVSRLSLDGRAHFTIRPGEILLLDNTPPMDWIMTHGYTCSNFVIDAEVLHRHVAEPARVTGRPMVLPYGFNGILLGMLDTALHMARTGDFERGGARLVNSLLETLALGLALEADGDPAHASALELRRNQARRYIERNFGRPGLTVADIARELGFSTRYLQLAFAAGDDSPLDYLRTVRLAAAATRLLDPAYRHADITRIALDCGFGSSTHFATEFRRRYGVAPREYRRGRRDH